MESLLAIGVGLVLRIVVDVATDNDDRVGGVLVGLWEGVVLNHFVRRMPRSFDPYLGFGFRIFVDFLFTQSLSRLALVALWTLVGMLLADIAPNVWRESGLRHLYRQVRKDVRHVKRSVPHIRIKNDFPSVRLFNKSRSTSLEVSGSIRSDRATPASSPAPSRAPTPGPGRRPGRSPPGTFPDVSGWSETGTDISIPRERVVMDPGPSPTLIPSREHAAYGRVDTAHVTMSETRTTTIQNTVISISQTQNDSVLLETAVDTVKPGDPAASTSQEPLDDPSHDSPPAIPDDWVDIDHPTPAKSNEPVAPFQPDPDSTPEPQPGPSTLTQSRPASTLKAPPAIDVLPDIPDVDHVNRALHAPDQIPLPESRAASVIGGIYDQPKPRSALRDVLDSRVDKATSEIGVDPARSRAPIAETQSVKSQSTRRGWTSWTGSRSKPSLDPSAPEPTPKESKEEPISQAKPDAGPIVQDFDPQICTPAQVDPPSILTQPGDAPPLLLTSEPELGQGLVQAQISKPDQTLGSSPRVDSDPAPPQGGPDKGDDVGRSRTSPFDIPSPSRTPPPPFTEFSGVPEGLAAGENPAEEVVTIQDESPTELTKEQKAAEEKRIAFLLSQVQELEGARAKLHAKLDKEDDPTSSPANAIRSDLEDAEKVLNSIKARMIKKKFTEPPPNPPIEEVPLTNKSVADVQFAITSAVLNVLLGRDDAGPMTIQAVINKQKPLRGKAKETKDTVTAFAKLHQFMARSDSATPGIINITF